MYEPFSGRPIHQNYSDQLLRHFNLMSDSLSFAVHFECPSDRVLMPVLERAGNDPYMFHDARVDDSLALYVLWSSGLMGIKEDPQDVAQEVKCGFRDFLSKINYGEIRLRYPEGAGRLNGQGVLYAECFDNLGGHPSRTYFGHDSIVDVKSFWGNVPEIKFDADEGYIATGRILGELFDPKEIYNNFSDCDGVKDYFKGEFDYYFKGGLLPGALGYDVSKPSELQEYKQNVTAFWVFAMTQGYTTMLIQDMYKLMS